MFATCIYCQKPLGANESLEAFPVGQRIAFDPARGRLWVVCRSCERWNLSPLDERWEAIEQAERLYRDTRRRVSTDNIGLARLREGTTLVRIGEPQRPEFAAWRYGDQFGRRRTRAMLVAGGSIAAVAAVYIGGAAAGVGIGGFAGIFGQFSGVLVHGRANTVIAKVRTEDGQILEVRRRHLGESTLAQGDDGSFALNLRFKNGSRWFTGAEATRVAGIVVPKVNRFGGRKVEVEEAVSRIERAGHAEAYLSRIAGIAEHTAKRYDPSRERWYNRGNRQANFHKHGLFSLARPEALALEMALHEEAERRAMEGELAELEKAWRDAEEIAAIADNLLVPETVDEQFKKLKDGGSR